MDDHLTTVMFLDRSHKTLDYNFLLWKFDTSKLDHRTLQRLDGQQAPESKPEEDPAFRMDKEGKCGPCVIF